MTALDDRRRETRMAEIEAAAKLVAQGLAAAPPAVVESIVGKQMFCHGCDTAVPVRPWATEGGSYLCSQCFRPIRCDGCNRVWFDGHDCFAAADAELESRWLEDYTRPTEAVDAVRNALLADVGPMSFTGMALFILDALAAAGFEVTLSGRSLRDPDPRGGGGSGDAAVDRSPAAPNEALMAVAAEAWPPRPRAQYPRPTAPKEEAACCMAKRMPDGRPVIGFCGPDCERRP